MEFRPCIDIHNGRVKQIVGGSLSDEADYARENFVSEMRASDYARMYREKGLRGGHIILLNAADSHYYKEDLEQAREALAVWPGALQIGGGVTVENAAEFLAMGASHVIVTSYVFLGGEIHFERLEKLVAEVGKERLVLDLSCRFRDENYYIVTDRWQKFTRVKLTIETLKELSSYCDEFLIHAVDVEGQARGIEKELVALLAKADVCPITYAGGVGSLKDVRLLKELGRDRMDVTIGSALDLFGGALSFDEVLKVCAE